MWIDLSPQLPLREANGDSWAAEKLLSERFLKAGVKVDSGADYQSPEPGRFRLMFCVEEDTLREGIRRWAPPKLISSCVQRMLITCRIVTALKAE